MIKFIRIQNFLLLIMLLNSFTDHSFDVVTRYQVETNAGRWRAICFRCHFFKAVRHTLEPGRLQFWKGHNSSQTYHSWGGSYPLAAQMAIRNQRQLLWDNRLIFLPGKSLSNFYKFFNSLNNWLLNFNESFNSLIVPNFLTYLLMNE